MSISADYAPMRGRCAIAGIGRTEFSKDSGRSELTLACEAARSAVADAGLALADVDGLVRCDMDHVSPGSLIGALGLDQVGFACEVGVGGSAPSAMIGMAIAAILSGQARTVLVYRSLNGRSESRFGAAIAPRIHAGGQGNYDEFFTPYGLLTAPQAFALLAQRHAIEFGTKAEHLGAIAIACRENANRTPHAQMHAKALTMEDYLASRMIAAPLRLFDCCLETDGAAAVIVTSTERARDCAKGAVPIRATAQSPAPGMSGGMMFPVLTWDDPLKLSPRRVAETLWARAGIGPRDIDVAQIYDCFTISTLVQLEDYGFCEKGEGGPFAASGAIRSDGAIPINTDGGNMSGGYIHGLNHVVEGVRQMRGTADVQIAGAETCLVTSGPIGISSALVLEKAA
jgi:acetyl-CoA acetyltransferase